MRERGFRANSSHRDLVRHAPAGAVTCSPAVADLSQMQLFDGQSLVEAKVADSDATDALSEAAEREGRAA
jgi:hypothetical protein